MLGLLEEPGRFLATVQVGVTLAGFFASAVGAVSAAAALAGLLRASPLPFIADQADLLAVVAVTVVIAFASLILGELAPKNLAVRSAESVALAVAYPITWLERIASPIVWLLNATTNLILGGQAKMRLPSVTADEIVAIADVAMQEGVIDEREQMIVERALGLGRKRIGELVVPRVDVKALPEEATLREARDLIVQTGHTRIPVYRGTVDEVVGVLHSKDLLAALGGKALSPEGSVRRIVRPTMFVPETVRADEVLREMQRQRVHMAIVVDEYGGTAGIVTLENLLEELVGPIRDEYDAAEQPEIRRVSEDEVLATGDADLDEVSEALGVKIEQEGVDTIGGLVYATLGRIPEVGDRAELRGLRAEVLKMDGNRVLQVRLVKGDVQQVDVRMLDSGFEPGTVVVQASFPVRVSAQNQGSIRHDWTVELGGGQGIHLVADPGQSASATFTPTLPGEYRVICTQPDHEGVEASGKLVVRSS